MYVNDTRVYNIFDELYELKLNIRHKKYTLAAMELAEREVASMENLLMKIGLYDEYLTYEKYLSVRWY